MVVVAKFLRFAVVTIKSRMAVGTWGGGKAEGVGIYCFVEQHQRQRKVRV
jgi:hypothetical protein